jgi:hypothetical protein
MIEEKKVKIFSINSLDILNKQALEYRFSEGGYYTIEYIPHTQTQDIFCDYENVINSNITTERELRKLTFSDGFVTEEDSEDEIENEMESMLEAILYNTLKKLGVEEGELILFLNPEIEDYNKNKSIHG